MEDLDFYQKRVWYVSRVFKLVFQRKEITMW